MYFTHIISKKISIHHSLYACIYVPACTDHSFSEKKITGSLTAIILLHNTIRFELNQIYYFDTYTCTTNSYIPF